MTSLEICEIFSRIRPKELKVLPSQVLAAVQSGELSGTEALKDGFVKGMEDIGNRFKDGRVFLPEVMISAKTMNEAVKLLKPYLAADGGDKETGVAVLGTVKGDNHDIGKNIVKIMLEGRGIRVVDLGTDVSPEAFVETAEKEGAGIICASALLTTTMSVMGDICTLAKDKGIKVMVGGAPLSADFAESIGAYYAADAAAAADVAIKLLTA
ncbi:MAG: cobalamin-dependent protein [Clostridia bacterium]|nr:cobalamin-dependent protein [Clostridia bacterium]MBQ7047485.1 cobalamin-dependent protein [Clostridia bacterium]